MRASEILPRDHGALDFGSGKGILVRLLRDEAQSAVGYEPYVRPTFAEQHTFREAPDGRYALVLATEVIEHVPDPVVFLSTLVSCLAPRGVILLTTELYVPGVDLRKWPYLSLDSGQHILLMTESGLSAAAAITGLVYFQSLAVLGARIVHLLCRSGEEPPRVRQIALRALHVLGERRHTVDAFV
jgi:2-polyprenyl-3-methyl-5-hydroxy-6-metoxy-1,4-benzoquinol methylase